jgi:hypothetical protein
VNPVVLFGVQLTLALVAYALIAGWYVWPRLVPLPLLVALQPLVWVHVFRVVGGSILAPGSVGPGVPDDFARLVGYGDLVTAVLALVAVVALRLRWAAAIPLVWTFVVVGTLDTVDAIVQSVRYDVFHQPLGVSWVVVTLYVPALVVSMVLVVVTLVTADRRVPPSAESARRPVGGLH